MWLLLACTGPADTGETAWERGENPHPLDDILRLNHVQAEGSHNSTHVQPDTPIDDSHRYTHAPLYTQLSELGVRQLELDLHRTEDGTWHIFHLPVVDDETTCQKLSSCLGEIKQFSDEAGWHLPIMVWMEPKDDVDEFTEDYVAIEDIRDIDAAILEVFPRERVFAPDDLRGDHADLPTALREDGWPLMGEVRGKVMFALLDTGDHRDLYTTGAPVLEDRLLFVDSAPDEPFAAMIKDGSDDELTTWAEAGYLVTTNAAGAGSSDEDNEAAWLGTLSTGAHFIATDLSGPTDRAFEAVVPEGTPARCNPVTAPAECTPGSVEAL